MTTSYYNKNWQELESKAGSETTVYIWGERYIDDLILREKGAEKLYSLADSNWNTVTITNASGIIQERLKYDAFGKVTWLNATFGIKTTSSYNWNRTFTSQVRDNESGLMLYRNRYYNVGLGRFINRDAIEYLAGDVNVYRYVFNNPLRFADPDGLGIKSTVKGWGKSIKKWAGNMLTYLPTPKAPIVGGIGTAAGAFEVVPAAASAVTTGISRNNLINGLANPNISNPEQDNLFNNYQDRCKQVNLNQ